MPEIPCDIYNSPAEMMIVLPLGGVQKDSLQITIQETVLVVTAQRVAPPSKESLAPLSQQCYRGSFTKEVKLPSTSFFNGIHSTLTPSNILIITIPKVMVPESVPVSIE